MLEFPVFGGVRYLDAPDGAGDHVLALHVQGAHGQRETEHNEARAGFGQAELVFGDSAVEPAPGLR